jgi:hypothetical protein
VTLVDTSVWVRMLRGEADAGLTVEIESGLLDFRAKDVGAWPSKVVGSGTRLLADNNWTGGTRA